MACATRRRFSYLMSAAAALLLVAGCGGAAATQPGTATPPPVSAASAPVQMSAPAASGAAPSSVPAATDPGSPRALGKSVPVALAIPAIGAQSPLLSLGLREDGTLQVPPGDPGSPASWYDKSPTPGERGPAVVLGHVNATDGGDGVFAKLRELQPGDSIDVQRKDGTTAVFTVDRGEQYSKSTFPTNTVYGNTAGPELRLITCDGYDAATGEFDDNYVVYAKFAEKQ